jgi:hypothetical protein
MREMYESWSSLSGWLGLLLYVTRSVVPPLLVGQNWLWLAPDAPLLAETLSGYAITWQGVARDHRHRSMSVVPCHLS